MVDFYIQRIAESRATLDALLGDKSALEAIARAGELMASALRVGGRVLLCGNGGSATDAQHIAAELVGRFYKNRPALDAEALTVNTASLTAIGNDFGFDQILSRQVEAKGRKGDVLVGITTSGNSPNVIRALEKGREKGLTLIGLTGANREAAVFKSADVVVAVPSAVTPRIQEAHILIGHMWCEHIERSLFPE